MASAVKCLLSPFFDIKTDQKEHVYKDASSTFVGRGDRFVHVQDDKALKELVREMIKHNIAWTIIFVEFEIGSEPHKGTHLLRKFKKGFTYQLLE